ncbi:MAG: META domain-containing protein [Betaproteobacteria bacterium]
MSIRRSLLALLPLIALVAGNLALLLSGNAAIAATAMAIYRGDLPATTSSASRKFEMRLKADGTMSLTADAGSNRPAVTEDGRWNPISLEQIDVIIERRNGVATVPTVMHFVRKGDALQVTPDSAAPFGGQILQLRQTKSATVAAAVPILRTVDATGVWRWDGIVAPTGTVKVEQPERYTLDLQAGGKAVIRANCNRGQAGYKFDGQSAVIRISGMSKTACPGDTLSDRFLKSMESATGQRMRGDLLFLDLPGSGGTMKFMRAK